MGGGRHGGGGLGVGGGGGEGSGGLGVGGGGAWTAVTISSKAKYSILFDSHFSRCRGCVALMRSDVCGLAARVPLRSSGERC